jgi:hypothetical protein
LKAKGDAGKIIIKKSLRIECGKEEDLNGIKDQNQWWRRSKFLFWNLK